MKKSFVAPQLKNHGALSEVTQAFGDPGPSDTLFLGNASFPGSVLGLSGSQDGVVGPKK